MHERVSLEGAVDLHGHCGPSPFLRRVDGYEFAKEAADAGMDGVVLKEHSLPTIGGIPYIQRLLERDGRDIFVGGGTALNYCNGGFNPFHVQAAIDNGATVIWGPTIDSKENARATGKVGRHGRFGDVSIQQEYRDKEGLTPLDPDGNLKQRVQQCIEKIVEHDIILGIGHLTFDETDAIVEYAVDRGHDKIIIDHPRYPSDFDSAQRQTLVSYGAYLNFLFVSVSPTMHRLTVEELYDNIRTAGVDNCTISSGTGQLTNPSSPEALRMLAESLVECGLSVEDIDTMVKENPKHLLAL